MYPFKLTESHWRATGGALTSSRNPRILPTLLASAAILLAAGSSAYAQPQIERIDSPSLRIRDVRIDASHGGLEVRGRLEKRPPGHIARHRAGRSPIQGHLQVTALDANGAILTSELITDYGPSARLGVATFSRTLRVPVDEVTSVRLLYHRGRIENGAHETC